LILKPIVYRVLLHRLGHEDESSAKEVGFRIGQLSEFSILLGALALNVGVLGERAAYLIHVATIITFIISSYIVVFKYPSPMALSDRLRRD
jgi:predicted Kef-type K+ transport protein